MSPKYIISLICLLSFHVIAQTPLLRVHAHNDYEHPRPLLDALDHGFCSVEADIFLVNGKLLVGHNRQELEPDRTLEKLYLDPLRERVRLNHGRVYAHGPEVTLLIDLKTDWRSTYPVLRSVLTNYLEILTTFQDNQKQTNAVLAIISGNRSLTMFDGERLRVAAYDGTLNDLNPSLPATLVPWISADWQDEFRWNGEGTMPENETNRLAELVRKAHAQGRRLRFWGAPDNPHFWQAMLAANVDLINTDDLAGAEKYLLEYQADSNGR